MNVYKQTGTSVLQVFTAVTFLLFAGDSTTACGFWPEETPSS